MTCLFKYFILFLLFQFSYGVGVSVHSQAGFLSIKNEPTQLFIPCKSNDLAGMQKSMNLFMEKSSRGIPEHNVTAIDNFVLPEVDVVTRHGVFLRFTDVHVKLPYFEYVDMKMDDHSYEETIKVYSIVDANLEITLTQSGKVFRGSLSATSTSIGHSKFDHKLVTSSSGQKHLELGPDDITIETTTNPYITMNLQLNQQLAKDPDARRVFSSFSMPTAVKPLINRSVKEVFITIMENFRKISKLMPASSFFSDL